ncbi:MAG: exodeoxyribonuclease small subunit [Clostridia bacterium]|nr:exodeoxyribonuclease small subunit [Clostridia bacterium]MDN5365462.1 exodeoxyribonuclease small subunit [Thermacetogenium sp.]
MEERENREESLTEESLTFEAALERLGAVVADLERGDLTLEEALASFQKGVGLLRYLVQKLDAFEEQVEVLLKDFESNAPAWLGNHDSGGGSR